MTDTLSGGLWDTISQNVSNRLRMFGIAGTPTKKSEFDYEFNLSTRNRKTPTLIQIKTTAGNETANVLDMAAVQKQVADIVGNSKVKRFVAEVDTEGKIRPVYFVDFRGNEVSL